LKKFWKKVIPDFEIRINLKNYNNSIWKTKSGSGVILKKNRAREEKYRVEKVKLFGILLVFWA